MKIVSIDHCFIDKVNCGVFYCASIRDCLGSSVRPVPSLVTQSLLIAPIVSPFH